MLKMSAVCTAIFGAFMATTWIPAAAAADATLAERVMKLTRSSKWQLVETVPLAFPTHHPQGMVRIGDRFVMSSVEIVEPTQRYPEPRDGLDRSAGKGRGHLFEFDMQGRLLRQTTLGEGDSYHPGGIDYDGKDIWVPVAEYRPDSKAIVYRVDGATLKAVEMLRANDHIGGVVHAADKGELHAVSWGSRRFHKWTLAGGPKATPPRANPSHYIDYQDCHYLGAGRMLCSGLNAYRMRPDAPRFALGGIEVVDLASGTAIHQVPVLQWTETGLPMTQNPFWAESRGAALRFYFVPEDDTSKMYVYDVTP